MYTIANYAVHVVNDKALITMRRYPVLEGNEDCALSDRFIDVLPSGKHEETIDLDDLPTLLNDLGQPYTPGKLNYYFNVRS